MMDLKIKIDSYYKMFYIFSLTTLFFIKSIEISIILSLLYASIILFSSKNKVTRSFYISLLSLLLILTIGISSSLFYKVTFYDFIKDFVYFIKPLIYLILGYLLARNLLDKGYIFKAVVFLGIFSAVIHFIQLGIYFIEGNAFQINAIRAAGGKDNFLELLSLLLLIFNKNNRVFVLNMKQRQFIFSLITISVIFYFSRTMLVAFLIILFAANGYAKITRKSLKMILIIFIGILTVYYILNSINLERGATGIEGFLYKIRMAPAEIFSLDVDFTDPAERWDQWRAYEAFKAIEQASDTPLKLGLFFGKGFGSLIDLGFEAELNNETIQFIPKIHNGYAYILFKTGLLGLFAYFIFLSRLYLQVYVRSNSQVRSFINNLISGIGLYYFFTSFIISGIYNGTDIISIFLGALLFLQFYYKKNNEISYNRH